MEIFSYVDRLTSPRNTFCGDTEKKLCRTEIPLYIVISVFCACHFSSQVSLLNSVAALKGYSYLLAAEKQTAWEPNGRIQTCLCVGVILQLYQENLLWPHRHFFNALTWAKFCFNQVKISNRQSICLARYLREITLHVLFCLHKT